MPGSAHSSILVVQTVLIHLSELSWSRVNHPSEVVSPGQVVEVYVLNVDRDRKRIGFETCAASTLSPGALCTRNTLWARSSMA